MKTHSDHRMRPLRLLLMFILLASCYSTANLLIDFFREFILPLSDAQHRKIKLKDDLRTASNTASEASASSNTNNELHKPRVVLWSDRLERLQPQWTTSTTAAASTTTTNRTMDLSELPIPQHLRILPPPLCDPEDSDCVIPGSWQTTNNMTCNPIHEIDLNHFFDANDGAAAGPTITRQMERLRMVAKGSKRNVWKYLSEDVSSHSMFSSPRRRPVALKMFRYRMDKEYDFDPLTIEEQRRDAVLHEVTASSPYIVNMYGYCGASALFEFSDGGQLAGNIIKREGAMYGTELLRVAHRVAASVADVQMPDPAGLPTVAHADIHGQQWVKIDGEYKLTDFNLAIMLKRSKKTSKTLPFRRQVKDRVRSHNPSYQISQTYCTLFLSYSHLPLVIVNKVVRS